MSVPVDPRDDGLVEPVRLPDSDLDSLQASVSRLLQDSAEQARMLDTLAAAPPPFASFPGAPPSRPPAAPQFIALLDGEDYENELDALTDWVEEVLLHWYGREVSTAAPWCQQWQEHPEAVARLHALWLSYQQHREADAGPSAMAVWHRDFLDHTMAALRAPNGPFSACQTNPDVPQSHRLLPGPKGPARPGHAAS
ncbi:DUF4913 domain-containing protein [Streptomyces sp. YIM 98790]|uniref:DUF4913 domain-containing protein n=1 Tax=Streptomyces sp. YIM 98790 TaxID=2689077 RepID=UPI001FB6B78B|nr:DUF4913 domain-containing protein [Streptomyces sp. YIM 98790]